MNTDEAREAAWQREFADHGLEPPRHESEMWNYGFDAGYQAGQPQWVLIHSPDDLPKEKGKYLWQVRYQKPHIGYEEFVYIFFDPKDDFDFWNHEKYMAWMKLDPAPPQEDTNAD